MKTGLFISLGLWTAIIAITSLTGCAGMGTMIKAEAYRVDERQDSSKTYRQETKPIKCLFVSCDTPSRRYRDSEESGS